jgi:nitronate monooxygenase
MDTKFIAATESMADGRYKDMLVASSADGIVLTTAFTGLQSNMLRPSIAAAGLDSEDFPKRGTIDVAKDIDIGARDNRPARWRDVWSAGHSVPGDRGAFGKRSRRTHAGRIVRRLRRVFGCEET